MNHNHSILDNPGQFTEGITGTSEYRNEREKETEDQLLTRLRRAVRLGAFAKEAATKSENGYDTKESAVYRLIGHIDSFAEAQSELDNLRSLKDSGVHVSRNERKTHLRKVIGFNHAAKELVNLDPAIKLNDLARFTTQIYQRQHALELNKLSPEAQQQRVAWFYNNTKTTLNGMRHELAYEQILGELQYLGYDLDYQESDEEGELRGVDYSITLNGIQVDVDVKAGEGRTNLDRGQVWSHVNSHGVGYNAVDDFRGGFRISPETAADNAGAVLDDLQYIIYRQQAA